MQNNSKNLVKLLAVLFVSAVLSACASPARMNAMIPEITEKTIIEEDSILAQKIELAKVTGGEDTNPLWTSEVGDKEFYGALKNTLANHALLAENNGKYELVAELRELDQPMVGLDLTVTGDVRYVLKDLETDLVVFETVVKEEFTATFDDAFVAVERLRLANEGAIRINIGKFLEELISKSKKLDQVSAVGIGKISTVRVKT